MPKVVITHNVADVATWLTYKAEREEAVRGLGGTNVVEHVAHDGSNAIAVTVDLDDVDAFMAAVVSPPPEVAEVMQRHGVMPPLVAYVQP